MRFTYRQTIKRCLIAGMVTLFGLAASAGTAGAAPTVAPNITAKPSDPNITHAKAVFEYGKGAGETDTVTNFQCRQYKTATPPANPTTGWSSCGTTGDTGTRTYSNLTNESQTFEVRARNAANEAGPVSTYVWTQNLPLPTVAPVLSAQPEDPQTGIGTRFAFAVPEADTNLVDRYQCRLDSDAETWVNCASGEYVDSGIGNGPHTFDVRAGNQIGFGPAAERVTWTVDIPNPEPSVRISDVASMRWDGYPGRNFGGMLLSGGEGAQTKISEDVNGDGQDDLLVGGDRDLVQGGPPSKYYVLFTGKGGGSIDQLAPAQGYAVSVPNQVKYAEPLSDQNGDGIADSLISTWLAGNNYATYVVYGVDDPATLPLCEPGKATRCLDVATMNPDQGYGISQGTCLLNGTTPIRAHVGFHARNAGDFDGDGIDDMLLSGQSIPCFNRVLILKGGVERTGEVDPIALDESQVFTLTRDTQTTGVFPASPGPVGDINGDGRDDYYVRNLVSGFGYVVYGREIPSPELMLSGFSADDGVQFASEATFGQLQPSGVGDWNDDGRNDLAVVDGTTHPFTVMYMPELPFGDFLVPSADLPATEALRIDDPERDGTGTGQFGPGNDIGIAGDVDNDGHPDMLVGSSTVPADGTKLGGAAYVLFNHGSDNANFSVGSELTAEDGVAILPDEGSGTRFAGSAKDVGDIDGDGLDDYVIGHNGANHNGTAAGAVYLVPGKNLINQVKTQQATAASNSSAVLNAGLSTNNRDSEVWFEYGTSDEYGQTTPIQEFEGSGAGDAVSAAVDGLTKNTTYHYRAVAKNALGLVRYGDDRTFTTTDSKLPSNCDTDDTLPGCAKWDPCAADNTKPGCSGYDHCAVKPADCSGSSNARLKVIAITKRLAVKRGKRGTAQVAVINTGGKAAKGVKLCVKAPKRLVKVKKCVKVGSLGSGASRTVKVKVKAKKKRGKAVLNLTAKGSNVSAKRTKARVVVR